MGDKKRGLYGKFYIERTDGKSAPGEKHDGCEYFVLDLTHDPFAWPALRAYEDACRQEYPQLSEDLRLRREKADQERSDCKPDPRESDAVAGGRAGKNTGVDLGLHNVRPEVRMRDERAGPSAAARSLLADGEKEGTNESDQ